MREHNGLSHDPRVIPVDLWMIMQSVSVLTLKGRSGLKRLLISDGNPHWNGDWIDWWLDDLRADDITGLEDIWFDYFVNGIRFYRLSHIVWTILALSILPAVASISHLILRDFRTLLSPALTPAWVLIEIFEGDVAHTDGAWLRSGSAGFHMLGVFYLRPSIFAVLADDGLPWAYFFMCSEDFGIDHLIAEGALFLLVEFFLGEGRGTSCCYWSLMSIIFSQLRHLRMLRQQ